MKLNYIKSQSSVKPDLVDTTIELHESSSYDCSFDFSYDPIEEYNKNKSIREKALCEFTKS